MKATADPVDVLARENRALHASIATLTAELLLTRAKLNDSNSRVKRLRQVLISVKSPMTGMDRQYLAEVGIEL